MISISSINQSLSPSRSSMQLSPRPSSKRFRLFPRRSASPAATKKVAVAPVVKRSLSHSINCQSCHQEVHDRCSLASQLEHVKQEIDILKLHLNNFVLNACPPQVAEMKDLILHDGRPWELIEFHDTVEGSNYRRWRFKRGAVDRRVRALKKELGSINVRFVTRVEIDFDKMDKDAVVSLLQALEKDRNVITLVFRGHISEAEIDDIVTAVEDLTTCDERVWDAILFHPSNDERKGHAHFVWKRTLLAASLRLQCLAHTYALPVAFRIIEQQ
ncbi:expressed unknown protein [Seminavis robusta]|uniref:Uncharacterized protein n=1 Tax=Seminavis robusta TaxID=568900 RepID=A0A9N8D9W4_9STRA|nr:expressed unknown protein [Seminavis robusta]|eukprot:Sro45_g027100.1 n/a (272) ;mRNA; f:114771-115586